MRAARSVATAQGWACLLGCFTDPEVFAIFSIRADLGGATEHLKQSVTG